MAVRSILDIDVDRDGSFKKFAAVFDKYQAALKTSPAQWAKVTQGIGRTRSEFDALVKQQVAVIARTKLIEQAQLAAEKQTRSWSDRFRDIAAYTSTIARNVSGIGSSLIRWSLIGTTASGLLGIGGLFGLDRLAGSVAGGRRASLGLGTGYGERRAFETNFARLVDTDSFLQAVADARSDVTKRVGFIGAGLTSKQTQGDTSDVAVALLRQLKRIADTNDPALYAQVIQSRQLGQFTSPTDLLRLRNTNAREFEDLVRSYGANRGSFGLDERTSKAWQDFTTQMSRAAQGIEATFVRGLVPLAHPLERLSAGFEKAVSAFLGSDTIKKWMDQAGEGLETLAKYVGTDDFQKSVKDFANGLGEMAKAIGSFVKWWGAPTPADAKVGGKLGEREGHDTWNQIVRGSREKRGTMLGIFGNHAASPEEREAYIRSEAKRLGIDPDQAMRVARSEGFKTFAGDMGTSFGDFQLHYKSSIPGFRQSGLGDAFTKYTGLDARDPSNWKAADRFALEQAAKGGWGPWHGWKGNPWEGIDRGAKVTVENLTGGSAIVTSSQLPQ